MLNVKNRLKPTGLKSFAVFFGHSFSPKEENGLLGWADKYVFEHPSSLWCDPAAL